MGISSTFFGLETLNSESGKCIGKGLDRDKQIETLQKLKENRSGSKFIKQKGAVRRPPFT